MHHLDMAAGCHGNTGSGCCGNRLFMISSNEIASNTSLQLSHCERQRRGGGWVGECNTGLIGVCIYSLCERVESEWKVDCKGKLICERCCCEQTGHDRCAYVCLSIYVLKPMHTFHNKSIKCKYLSLICPGHSLWEGFLILTLPLIGSRSLQDSAEMQIWCNRRQNEQQLLNTTWVYLYSVFTRLIPLTSWAPFYFWDRVSSVIICYRNYQRLNWGWELIRFYRYQHHYRFCLSIRFSIDFTSVFCVEKKSEHSIERVEKKASMWLRCVEAPLSVFSQKKPCLHGDNVIITEDIYPVLISWEAGALERRVSNTSHS